jgi:hypothetical protein
MLRVMSKIHFIGGEKGGVGKSVVARLVVQYCIDKRIPFAAVDADGSHSTLARYYAAYVRPADLYRSDGADEILTLATDADRHVVVDLPAQSHRLLSAWIGEAGILDLARESGVKIVFWHVLDDGKDSLTTLARLFEQYGQAASYCVVKNLGRGKDFSLFEASPVRATARTLGAEVIELPELNAAAMQKIDRLDASFWAAVNNPSFAPDTLNRRDRQRVKVWLQAWYDQLALLGDKL